MYGAGDMSASDLHTINACKSQGVEIRNRYECTLASARRERWMRRLTGRSAALRDLGEALSPFRLCGQRLLGAQTVPIERIVGSEGRCADFDAQFRPTQSHTRQRWYSIARARLEDIPLPPVTLIRVGEEYYVRDGRRRISVARAYGQLVIEAQVTVYDLSPRLAETPTTLMEPTGRPISAKVIG